MKFPYLQVAQQGKNAWWHYLLALVGIPVLLLMIFVMPIMIMFIIHLFSQGELTLADMRDSGQVSQTLQKNLPIWMFYLIGIIGNSAYISGPILVCKFWHQRSWLGIINPKLQFNSLRFWAAFGVWFGLLAASTGINYLLQPQSFQFVFQFKLWLNCFLFTILLAGCRALLTGLISGYILQGIGLLSQNFFLLIFLSGFLLSLPLTSDAWSFIRALSFGVGLTIFTLKNNSLELTLGIVFANSLLFSAFVQYQTQEKLTLVPSIFTLNLDTQPNSLIELVNIGMLLVRLGIFYFIFCRHTHQPEVMPE